MQRPYGRKIVVEFRSSTQPTLIALFKVYQSTTGLNCDFVDILPTLPLRDKAGLFSLGNPDRCLDRGDVLPLC